MNQRLITWFSVVGAVLVILGSLGEIVPGLLLILISLIYPPFFKGVFVEVKGLRPRKNLLVLLSWFFVFWAALSTLIVSPRSLAAWGIVIGLFIVVFIVFFAGAVAAKVNNELFWRFLIIGAIVATSYIFYDYFLVGHTRAELLVGCNAAGTLLLIALSVFLAAFYKEKSKYRFFYIPAALLAVSGILFTASRAAWIGIGVLFVSLPLFGGRSKKLLIILVCSVLVLGLMVYSNSYWRQRFVTIFDLDRNSARLNSYEAATSMMFENPFGIGLGNFYERHKEYVPQGSSPLSHAHNIYLQFGAELGVIGMILVTVIYLIIPFMCYKIAKFKPCFGPIGAGFLAIIVRELFDSTTLGLSVAGFMWFLFGLVFAEYVLVNQSYQAKISEIDARA